MGATRPTDRPQDPDLTELPEGQEGGEGANQTGVAPGEGLVEQPSTGPGMGVAATGEEARNAKNQFAAALQNSVSQALGETDIGGQFAVEFVPGGLRIQIMDKEGRPMFVSGQPRLTALAQLILSSVAERLATIPNKIALEGHTDAVTTISQELTNWELSTARASAARRFLSRHGIADDRLTMVAGYAATQPLSGTNPTDPVNRRIAIMIWDEPTKETPPPAPPVQEQSSSDVPPAAGEAETPSTPAAAPPPTTTRPTTRPNTLPTPKTPESIEQRLLEETLQRAATPDTSTAGPSTSQ
jgi:chemotaxis protein MotB